MDLDEISTDLKEIKLDLDEILADLKEIRQNLDENSSDLNRLDKKNLPTTPIRRTTSFWCVDDKVGWKSIFHALTCQLTYWSLVLGAETCR